MTSDTIVTSLPHPTLLPNKTISSDCNEHEHDKEDDPIYDDDDDDDDNKQEQLLTLERNRSKLLLLYHAATCTCEGYSPSLSSSVLVSNNEGCNVKYCCASKRLFQHMSRCIVQDCKVPGCKHSRNIWKHYRKCHLIINNKNKEEEEEEEMIGEGRNIVKNSTPSSSIFSSSSTKCELCSVVPYPYNPKILCPRFQIPITTSHTTVDDAEDDNSDNGSNNDSMDVIIGRRNNSNNDSDRRQQLQEEKQNRDIAVIASREGDYEMIAIPRKIMDINRLSLVSRHFTKNNDNINHGFGEDDVDEDDEYQNSVTAGGDDDDDDDVGVPLMMNTTTEYEKENAHVAVGRSRSSKSKNPKIGCSSGSSSNGGVHCMMDAFGTYFGKSSTYYSSSGSSHNVTKMKKKRSLQQQQQQQQHHDYNQKKLMKPKIYNKIGNSNNRKYQHLDENPKRQSQQPKLKGIIRHSSYFRATRGTPPLLDEEKAAFGTDVQEEEGEEAYETTISLPQNDGLVTVHSEDPRRGTRIRRIQRRFLA